MKGHRLDTGRKTLDLFETYVNLDIKHRLNRKLLTVGSNVRIEVMPDSMSFQERIDSVVSRYKPQFDSLKSEAEQMQRDFEEPSDVGAVLQIDIDVSWKKTDIVFDVPSVRMKKHNISFDLPEIKMTTKDMSFDTPSVKMVTKKVGEYPCFKGLKWYSCDLKMDVPELFMERQEISMDIPEVSMKRHDISFELPEFFMSRVDWSLHLPHFKIINVKAETQAMQDKGYNLTMRSKALGAAMKTEIDTIMAGGFGEGAQSIFSQREAIARPFNEAISTISETIDALTAKKIDPIKVPASGGDINLRKQLQEVVTKRDDALASFDAQTVASEGAFRALHEQELV